MSTGQQTDPSQNTEPQRVGSGSILRTIYRLVIGVILCTGALWWTIQTILLDNHAAKSAIRAMGSWNASERVSGIQELEIAGLGSSKIAIPPLIAALRDKEARVRTAAATALGPIGNDAANSGTDREAVRVTIMSLLSTFGDPEPSVRNAAANALMSLPIGAKPAFVDAEEVMATLVERLRDRDIQTRLAAIQILAALGRLIEGEPPKELVAGLADDSESIRAMTVVTLSSLARKHDALIPSLFQMMEQDKSAVRSACASVLERMETPSGFTANVVPDLVAALSRSDRLCVSVACSMLAKLGNSARASIPALIAVAQQQRTRSLTDEVAVWTPDRGAIVALGRIAPGTEFSPQVVEVLARLAQSDAPDKWRAAVHALEAFGTEAEPTVPMLIKLIPKSIESDVHFPDRTIIIRSFSSIAKGTKSADQVVAALVRVLQTSDLEVRQATVDTLGEFGPTAISAVPDLIRLLNAPGDTDRTNVGSSAIQALSRIAPGTPSSKIAVVALSNALKYESRLSGPAAAALQPFGAEAVSAIPQLRSLLNDLDTKDQSKTGVSLGKLWLRSNVQRTLETLLESVEQR